MKNRNMISAFLLITTLSLVSAPTIAAEKNPNSSEADTISPRLVMREVVSGQI